MVQSVSQGLERDVAQHYADPELLLRIYGGLQAAGIALEDLRAEHLAPVEEFHIGGREATEFVIDRLGLSTGQRVLDVGCGIGGAVRYVADHFDCAVTGIDLTDEFIAIARTLCELCGMHGRARFECSSALEMPFADASFDAAFSMHVAMNIKDRENLYREIARVLEPGALFAAYDVMQGPESGLNFPLPWAQGPDTSHLATPVQMTSYLQQAGFEVLECIDRTEYGIAFFEQAMARAAKIKPPLGVHLVMGDDAGLKMQNMLSNLTRGSIAPVVMLARKSNASLCGQGE